MKLEAISDALTEELRPLRFSSPAAYVYNPLEYARQPHRDYLRRFGGGRPEVLLIGMNPGPWGMAQTGVPFGAVEPVKNWLGVTGEVGKPPREHPKRPVVGLDCHRNEVSGERIWGWARQVFGTPERFFARFFVGNYCPLLFLDEGGRNVTPDKLKAAERRSLIEPCDRALRQLVAALGVSWVLGVGNWAEKRVREAFDGLDVEVEIGRILHPSPASPAANRGWAAAASRQLREMGIEV